MPITVNEKPDGLIFKIRVQPRSSRNQVLGLYGDALKINLTAPPVDNSANKACGAYLAKLHHPCIGPVPIRLPECLCLGPGIIPVESGIHWDQIFSTSC